MSKEFGQWVLGAMSGTSLDGVDAAMVRTDGVSVFEFGARAYRAYSEDERAVLRAGLGHWSGPEVEAATEVVQNAHTELLGQFSPDLVGFHGQTLAHDPRGKGTLQVGDGAALAKVLGAPVVWDFRSADVAMGGQGAPLAPFFHFACAKMIGATEPLVFVNLGGVGNLTWIDPTKPSPDAPGALLAFDTGPANAPIDTLMMARTGAAFDRDGALAAAGKVNERAVAKFLKDPYFLRVPPKSLDRDEFAQLPKLVANLADADAAATLTAICARTVAAGVAVCARAPRRVLVTGGGRHNRALMEMLAEAMACPVAPVEDVGLDGDMLEAQAFAYLAARVVRGLATSSPATTGVILALGGGTLSTP